MLGSNDREVNNSGHQSAKRYWNASHVPHLFRPRKKEKVCSMGKQGQGSHIHVNHLFMENESEIINLPFALPISRMRSPSFENVSIRDSYSSLGWHKPSLMTSITLMAALDTCRSVNLLQETAQWHTTKHSTTSVISKSRLTNKLKSWKTNVLCIKLLCTNMHLRDNIDIFFPCHLKKMPCSHFEKKKAS